MGICPICFIVSGVSLYMSGEKCPIRHLVLESSILAAMICDVQYFLGRTELNISDFGVGYYFIYIMLGYELSEIVARVIPKYIKLRLLR